MRSEARIKTAIWRDTDFTQLDITEQWAYFVILSQPTLNLCGVVSYNAGRWSALAADATPQRLRKAIAILAKTTPERPKIVVDETTEEVWVRTFVRHDGVLTKPNVIVSMTRDFAAIQSTTIREQFLEGLGEGFRKGLAEGFPELFRKGFWKRLAQPFREAFEQRFPESRARPLAQSLQPPASTSATEEFARFSNGTVRHPQPGKTNGNLRCGACGDSGFIQAGSEIAPCPADCAHTVCATCLGTTRVPGEPDDKGYSYAASCADCEGTGRAHQPPEAKP